MIDPMLSLALSVYSNPGVYAVLLGSGVSRSAGIPTGWEVVLDLIRKVAHLEGEDCEPEPDAWYTAKYGEAPDYAKLLNSLAKSSAERSQLLKSYFEPTDEEREQGLKVPTPAHAAIARLVAKGDIRVILTTNFDHLMEDALKSEGLNATVVSTVDAIKGAPPLAHTKCMVVKLHGDYLDSRIKNTPDELANYAHAMNHELDRVLDEFGLIICGWSAEWDTALRAALERSKSRRYTTYWASRGDLSPQAERLVTLRSAQTLNINGADKFFQDLADKVESLRNLNRPHPLSAKVAAETTKRYMVDERYRIRLYDLAIGETNQLNDEVSETKLPTAGVPFSAEAFRQRIQKYEALAEILTAIMIEGCYWGTAAQADLWRECLERIADAAVPLIGNAWTYSRLYVPAMLLYAGGISALVGQRYDTLATLLAKPTVRSGNKEEPFAEALSEVWVYRAFNNYPGWDNRRTPLSELLYAALREPLRERLPSDTRYQQCFDQFEYLFSLVVAGMPKNQSRLLNRKPFDEDHFWAPVGSFGWRIHGKSETSASRQIDKLLASSDLRNQLLMAGLFDGEQGRVEQTKAELDAFVARLGWWL